MQNNIKNIICPKCGESISIDDVLTSQIENKFKKDFEVKEKKLRELVEKESLEKLAQEKLGLEKKTTAEFGKSVEAEKIVADERNKLLEQQLADKDIKLKEARQNEIILIKDQQKLKDEKEAFELEKTRQLAEERKQIEEDASRKATDAKQSEIDQLNKKLSDATKAKDELARKLEQGSQQTQGEVQEIILEELLKSEFIYDDVVPVPKGVGGADVIQIVKTKKDVECGKIIWESKKTKTWTEGWVKKLKDDQRLVKADLAVIVTSAMPQGTSGITQKDGVWICDIKLAIAIANLLRHSLESVSRERSMSIGKNEKVEILYSYLTGTEFKQRIEVIVETFSNMKTSLDKEKLYFTKTWAEKEKQIDRVIQNTVGIYGDLSGVVQLQKIESLELPEPTEDKN
jgi:hypothetical protein